MFCNLAVRHQTGDGKRRWKKLLQVQLLKGWAMRRAPQQAGCVATGGARHPGAAPTLAGACTWPTAPKKHSLFSDLDF